MPTYRAPDFRQIVDSYAATSERWPDASIDGSETIDMVQVEPDETVD